ncbi:cysteine hydrolase family protein [Clostridium baratii]|uniref:cysteine hydrolase family protein n=1 Tax=Clostridium baratii TaxID=1561 RepID=UPI001C221C99|nr:cysteine hydrolase family protein [Clostridium baratii]
MNKKALLVVDVQTALVLEKPFAVEEVISNIKSLLKICRENDVEIIYVRHNGEVGTELEANTDGWSIYNEIKPIGNEKIINKNFNSAFRGTELKEYLDKKGIKELILTGIQTEYCIDATCKVAFEYEFKVIIPEMTNTTFDNEYMSAEFLYKYYNFNIFDRRFATVESIEDTIERLTHI